MLVLETYTYNALTRHVCYQVTKKIQIDDLIEENFMDETMFMDNTSTNSTTPIKASRALVQKVKDNVNKCLI